MATVEGDQPRVRMLAFGFADETGFYFQTGSMKEFSHQLENNPKAEACFYNSDGMIDSLVCVAGIVEFLTDTGMKEKAMVDRPFLKRFGLIADSPDLILFRISHGQAHYWTMENTLLPKEII